MKKFKLQEARERSTKILYYVKRKENGRELE
jgi:hypothetical protein